MKISIVVILILLTIINILPYSQAQGEEKDQALIQTTCKNTPHYQLCINTLRAKRGSATADITGLSLIMVAAVKEKTKVALSIIYKLTKTGHRNLAPPLQRCMEVYKTVLKANIHEAVEALTKGDPKFAENGMADTVVESDVCEGSFGRVGVKSPLTGVNIAIHDLAQVARGIIRNLL